MEEPHAKYREISESNITHSDPKEASALGLCWKESHGECIAEYQQKQKPIQVGSLEGIHVKLTRKSHFSFHCIHVGTLKETSECTNICRYYILKFLKTRQGMGHDILNDYQIQMQDGTSGE